MSIVARRKKSSQLSAPGGAGRGEGGASSNTPPPISQPISWGGEDTAVIGVGVEWGIGWGELIEKLEAGKEAAQTEGKEIPVNCGGRTFLVSGRGFPAGCGKGSFHSYVLQVEGITISLVRRDRPYAQTPNVRVTIGSLALTAGGGLETSWQKARMLLERLGAGILWDKLSRVDPCVDLAELDVQELVDLVHAKQFVARANYRAVYSEGLHDTGFAFGKTAVRLRVYDKLQEVKREPRKFEALRSFRWGYRPKRATRVEFQLRREILKEFGIDSVADYLEKRGSLLKYLCSDWVRFTEGGVDRTHTARAAVHPLWRKVQEAFAAWAGMNDQGLHRVKRVAADGFVLMKQALGCLVSVLAYESEGELYDREEFTSRAVEKLGELLGTMDVAELMGDRMTRLCAAGPRWGLLPAVEAGA